MECEPLVARAVGALPPTEGRRWILRGEIDASGIIIQGENGARVEGGVRSMGR